MHCPAVLRASAWKSFRSSAFKLSEDIHITHQNPCKQHYPDTGRSDLAIFLFPQLSLIQTNLEKPHAVLA